jgi:Flp pilus assembly protein protease CpaA
VSRVVAVTYGVGVNDVVVVMMFVALVSCLETFFSFFGGGDPKFMASLSRVRV